MDVRNGFVFGGVVALFLLPRASAWAACRSGTTILYRKYSPRDRHNFKRQ
jgi:hypothetical protein